MKTLMTVSMLVLAIMTCIEAKAIDIRAISNDMVSENKTLRYSAEAYVSGLVKGTIIGAEYRNCYDYAPTMIKAIYYSLREVAGYRTTIEPEYQHQSGLEDFVYDFVITTCEQPSNKKLGI